MGGSSSKTYTDIQVQPLMDHPEKWYKAAMRSVYKNVPNGMKSVMSQYVTNMTDARSMFNDGYLTALGYNPRETINYRVIDPDLVLSWAKSNIGSSVTSISNAKFAVPTMEELALEYLQDTYTNMNLSEKSFYKDGVKWYVSGVTVVSSSGSDATCYKDKAITVTNYGLLHNLVFVSISDSMVTVNGVNYWEATLNTGGVIKVPVEYTTIACPGINTEMVSSIISTYNNKIIPVTKYFDENSTYSLNVILSVKLNAKGEIEVSGVAKNVSYNYWSSEWYTLATKDAIETEVGKVKTEIAAIMLDSSERLIFNYTIGGIDKIMVVLLPDKMQVCSIANAKAYPIIPLKENFALIKESTKMKALFNKLGMSGSDFEDSISDNRLKNAAILFVVDIDNESEAGTKYIFDTLVNMVTTTVAGPKDTVETNYHLDYGFSDTNMYTKIGFSLKYAEGNVCDVGKYIRFTKSEVVSYRDSETNATVQETITYKGIRKQINSILYLEMLFTSGNTKWEVGGYTFDKFLSDNEPVYIPVVDIGLADLSYEQLCYVLSLSVNLMTTSVVTVKTKWYQSGFFKFVMIVAIAVAAFYTGGAALQAYGWLAAATVYAGAAVSILGIMGVNTGIAGQVLGVAAILAGGYVAIANATTAGGQTLATASTLTQLAKVASDFNLQGTLESIEKQRVAKQAELEASGEKVQEMYDSMQGGLWMGVADRSPDMLYAMSSTQMMCNYDLLYDYDGLIDGQIKSVGI